MRRLSLILMSLFVIASLGGQVWAKGVRHRDARGRFAKLNKLNQRQYQKASEKIWYEISTRGREGLEKLRAKTYHDKDLQAAGMSKEAVEAMRAMETQMNEQVWPRVFFIARLEKGRVPEVRSGSKRGALEFYAIQLALPFSKGPFPPTRSLQIDQHGNIYHY